MYQFQFQFQQANIRNIFLFQKKYAHRMREKLSLIGWLEIHAKVFSLEGRCCDLRRHEGGVREVHRLAQLKSRKPKHAPRRKSNLLFKETVETSETAATFL